MALDRQSTEKKEFPETLASLASDRVRAIVEAAEASAAEIRRDAENEAREIRDAANREAQATREQATEQAREIVAKVSESIGTIREHLRAMENELGSLVDPLSAGSDRSSPVEPVVTTNGEPPSGQTASAQSSDDAEGARLIALNMALNGTPRQETERYLTENFSLSNAGELLDEVYASVEG